MVHQFYTPPTEVQELMDLSLKHLVNYQKTECQICFYNWKNPSISVGYFENPKNWLDIDECSKMGLDIGKRPTGGGVLFHTHDLAFYLIIPKSHPIALLPVIEAYREVNSIVKDVILDYLRDDKQDLQLDLDGKYEKHMPFCMAKPTVYDVMIDGKKIAGAAQRRKPQGILHQGSISIIKPVIDQLERTIIKKDIVDHIQTFGGWLSDDESDFERIKADLKEKLLYCFNRRL